MEKINFVNNSEPYLSAENLNQMQDNMENAVKTRTLLWSNNNLDTLGMTNITLSSEDYEMLQVFYTRDASDKTLLMSQFTLKGYGFWLDSLLNGASLWRRAIGRNSDTSYTIYRCNKYNGGSSVLEYDDTALIPVAIYGIKGGIK